MFIDIQDVLFIVVICLALINKKVTTLIVFQMDSNKSFII